MSTRMAKRTLTGAPVNAETTIALGVRKNGDRGVTIHARYREPWPFTDPGLLDQLANDLRDAAAYLRWEADE